VKIFIEQQRFNQPWILILIGFSTLLPVGIIIHEYTKEGTKMSTTEFIFVLSAIFLATSIIFIFKLATRIDEYGIHYCFFPFHLSSKLIAWSEIRSATVRTYDPISEYGGWGLKGRFRKKSGKAMNVRGNIGIQLELKNGKKLLIGTQKEEEAKRVLKTYEAKI